MTAGQDALREAARLEAARVYSRVCPEHRNHETQDVDDELAMRREARAAVARRNALREGTA